MIDLQKICLRTHRTLREAMVVLNRTAKGIVLVVDEDRRLLCTITDGDLRRAILHGLDQDTSIEAWMVVRAQVGGIHPTTAPVGTDTVELIRIMQGGFHHIPLLDDQGRVADVALMSELVTQADLKLSAIVMAGGQGTRLRPLTADVPKPMLHVGDRPVIEHIITSLRDAGIGQVRISTHYKADVITNHFGDGQKFGVEIDYLNEADPLGTAGALSLMPGWQSTLLVINGDILTALNYKAMLAFHRENDAVMTVGVRRYEFEVPYGVVQTEGVRVEKLSEKPTLRFFVNAGVYLLEPGVSRHVVPKQRCDMPDLIARLLEDKERVVSFPISEYWLDMGHHGDYEQAQAAYARDEFR